MGSFLCQNASSFSTATALRVPPLAISSAHTLALHRGHLWRRRLCLKGGAAMRISPQALHRVRIQAQGVTNNKYRGATKLPPFIDLHLFQP